MKSKGQFLIISAVIASLIVITLSSSIASIQSHSYTSTDLPDYINQLKDEAERITADGDITEEEKRNFRKMTGFIEEYEVTTTFNESANCVQVQLQNTQRRAEIPCIN